MTSATDAGRVTGTPDSAHDTQADSRKGAEQGKQLLRHRISQD